MAGSRASLTGGAIQAEALLFALKHCFSHAGALAALAGNPKPVPQVGQAVGALGSGLPNLSFINVVTKTDVHGRPLICQKSGENLILMRMIVNTISGNDL
ncbi:MAG: hypothetical protein NWS96_11280 [Pseudomonadales bacterium]|jgi:hypothetical protein|nr:hypothetical protein [Pseudomonadales bacterium]MDP4639571.1 hypothetical protein [Pseudomonadales bacterium]MDP4912320.1 hypothetical protein [Pseudomonadales bacterium]